MVAKALADYLQATTEFSLDNAHFRALGTTIYKNEAIYIPSKQDSPFYIFGNCNLQAFHSKGAEIASNLAFFLNKEVDYLGRKLIFLAKEFKMKPLMSELSKNTAKKTLRFALAFLAGVSCAPLFSQ